MNAPVATLYPWYAQLEHTLCKDKRRAWPVLLGLIAQIEELRLLLHAQVVNTLKLMHCN